MKNKCQNCSDMWIRKDMAVMQLSKVTDDNEKLKAQLKEAEKVIDACENEADNYMEELQGYQITNIIDEYKAENKRLLSQFAESVCKECKCEVNTQVNHDIIDRNLKLREENKKLRGCVEFYASITAPLPAQIMDNEEIKEMKYMDNAPYYRGGKTARETLNEIDNTNSGK